MTQASLVTNLDLVLHTREVGEVLFRKSPQEVVDDDVVVIEAFHGGNGVLFNTTKQQIDTSSVQQHISRIQ